jgi:AbrB family looped-hinge helix DNA binding protein
MRTAIDGSGRIVVPKALRDALRLEGGTPLDIRVRDGRLEIEPIATPMRLVPRGKGLVAVADGPLPAIDAEAVRSATESLRR